MRPCPKCLGVGMVYTSKASVQLCSLCKGDGEVEGQADKPQASVDNMVKAADHVMEVLGHGNRRPPEDEEHKSSTPTEVTAEEDEDERF